MRYESLSYYDMVPALSVKTSHVVPGNGEVWSISRFIAGAAYTPDARVCLIWDYQGQNQSVIRSSHGDVDLSVQHVITGDGSKKLSIILTNDTLVPKSLGASFEARVN